MQIVVRMFCGICYTLAPLSLNTNPNSQHYATQAGKTTAAGYKTKQEKRKSLSHSLVSGSFMNNAVSPRLGRWRADASLSFKHRVFDI